ncbi:MAG: hypothetical protein ABIJ97_12230, partial [Bacteroidota bacterium]
MKNGAGTLSIIILFSVLFSCKEQNTVHDEKAPLISVKTSQVKLGEIETYISLYGKTVYLKKNTIVAPISGYIIKVYPKFGSFVQKDEIIFEIQTKESKALENSGVYSDSIGIIKVRASSGGIINELNVNEAGA